MQKALTGGSAWDPLAQTVSMQLGVSIQDCVATGTAVRESFS
jgi:hypothetical protein